MRADRQTDKHNIHHNASHLSRGEVKIVLVRCMQIAALFPVSTFLAHRVFISAMCVNASSVGASEKYKQAEKIPHSMSHRPHFAAGVI